MKAHVIFREIETVMGTKVSVPIEACEEEQTAKRKAEEINTATSGMFGSQTSSGLTVKSILAQLGIRSISHRILPMEVSGRIEQVRQPNLIKPG